jgi:sortase A
MRAAASRGKPPQRLVGLALLAAGITLVATGVWLPAKAELAQRLLNRAWLATQHGGGEVKPWPWADTWPIARLLLPQHEPLIVLADATGRSLAFAPGWLTGSAAPGEVGVAVIAGHRDTHFAALATLLVGEHFEIERPDRSRLVYEVSSVAIMDTARESLALQSDRSMVALVTCWPFNAWIAGGSLRYVVWGTLTDASAAGSARAAAQRIDARARLADAGSAAMAHGAERL